MVFDQILVLSVVRPRGCLIHFLSHIRFSIMSIAWSFILKCTVRLIIVGSGLIRNRLSFLFPTFSDQSRISFVVIDAYLEQTIAFAPWQKECVTTHAIIKNSDLCEALVIDLPTPSRTAGRGRPRRSRLPSPARQQGTAGRAPSAPHAPTGRASNPARPSREEAPR